MKIDVKNVLFLAKYYINEKYAETTIATHKPNGRIINMNVISRYVRTIV